MSISYKEYSKNAYTIGFTGIDKNTGVKSTRYVTTFSWTVENAIKECVGMLANDISRSIAIVDPVTIASIKVGVVGDGRELKDADMSFGDAIFLMKQGFKMSRRKWESGAYAVIDTEYRKSNIDLPKHLADHMPFIKRVTEAKVVSQPWWMIDHSSVCSEDWYIVEYPVR